MTAKEFNRCLDALPNDRNALEKIYNEYYLQLVYTALSMTKNREAAYDIDMHPKSWTDFWRCIFSCQEERSLTQSTRQNSR